MQKIGVIKKGSAKLVYQRTMDQAKTHKHFCIYNQQIVIQRRHLGKVPIINGYKTTTNHQNFSYVVKDCESPPPQYSW